MEILVKGAGFSFSTSPFVLSRLMSWTVVVRTVSWYFLRLGRVISIQLATGRGLRDTGSKRYR